MLHYTYGLLNQQTAGLKNIKPLNVERLNIKKRTKAP
ncbi:hypothetical protein SAMN04488688_101239 [Paenibacillus sp. cl141a]|nr:hypothetical protein SAMN04488688_101239 [Paenibacillus sp. cl141a]